MKKTYKSMHRCRKLIDDIIKNQSIIIAHFYDYSKSDESVLFDLKFVRYKADSLCTGWKKTDEISLEKKTEINTADKNLLCDFLSGNEPIVTANFGCVSGLLFAIGELKQNRLYDLFCLASEVIYTNDKYDAQYERFSEVVSKISSDADFEIEKVRTSISTLISEYLDIFSKQKQENFSCRKSKIVSIKPKFLKKNNNYLLIKTADNIVCFFRLDYGYFFAFDDVNLDYIAKECFKLCEVKNESELARLFYENHELIIKKQENKDYE